MNKTGSSFLIVVLFLFSFCLPLVYADRGMIPVNPEVSVYEPGQKAILAWNGHEEVMILSTDITSSQETLVVEILPLPSKPVVEAASFQSFGEIQRLIWNEGLNMLHYDTEGQARSGSVEVVFHEQIGVHNITVVTASVTSELGSWMENFLEDSGVEYEVSLGSFESVIEDYMDRGFRYYVLDLITVSSEEKSVDPILYKFSSDFLYYPLLITSPVGGDTEITLFVLTEDTIELVDYFGFQKAHYNLPTGTSKPIEFVLSKGDLSKIDLRIGEIFQHLAWLTVLKFNGKTSWLTKDLMISASPTTEPTISIEIALPPTVIFLLILLGVASTLAGVISTLLITRFKPFRKRK